MIVVFGSLNADLVFPVTALPRAGETVACESVLLMPGGKGANQAVAAARAGASVHMVGCVGEDPFGGPLTEALAESGVDVGAVGRGEAPTGCAAVVVDAEGRNQIAIAGGANLEARAADVDDAFLGAGTTVLLQMEVQAEENWALVTRARAQGSRVMLNAAPAAAVPADVLKDLDVLLVNEIEAATVAEAAGVSAAGPVEAARSLAKGFEIGCIVTMGAEGAFASLAEGEWAVDALPIEPVDTTAAGDAFVGVFAAALDEGRAVTDALHRASVAGGLACLTTGAQPSLPTAAEIDGRLAGLAPVRGI